MDIYNRNNNNSVLKKVKSMTKDHAALKLAKRHNLDIQEVCWEDNARTKNSSFGPCISDMTLEVKGERLPVIRYSNFTDVTWDVPLESIPIVVGNESQPQDLRTVSLKEYLNNFNEYLPKSESRLQRVKSLLRSNDTHAVVSAQACFLPVESGQDTKFNVSIFNYQTRETDPAIMTLVCSSRGTATQVVNQTGWTGQQLFHNNSGQAASFMAQRLTDFRTNTGSTNTGEMTSEEKQDNILLIVQIPLKQKPAPVYRQFGMSKGISIQGASLYSMNSSKNESVEECAFYCDEEDGDCDVEDAILTVGENEGPFKGLQGFSVERDERFPVRVTLQYYKCTSNGVLSEEAISQVATQIKNSQAKSDFLGSLVTVPNFGRPTEHNCADIKEKSGFITVGCPHCSRSKSIARPNWTPL